MLPNDFINVAFVVCRSAMLAIQDFHLKHSPLISCEDSLPNLLAKNVCGEIFLSVDSIPGERQIWLRRIALRSPRCLWVHRSYFYCGALSCKYLTVRERP